MSTFPIVEAICAMAHKLGKQVVAEGIETAYQRDFVRRLGVDLAQGYFFARPMKPLDAEALLRRVTKDAATAARLQAQVPVVKPAAPLYRSVVDEHSEPLNDLPPLFEVEVPAGNMAAGSRSQQLHSEALGSSLEDLLLHEVEPKSIPN